jgi:hypothetical protein
LTKVRCKGKTKFGDQCRNNAIPGTTFCYLRSHRAPGQTSLRIYWNFLWNHSLSVVAVLSLLLAIIPLLLYIQDRKHDATSGVMTPSDEALPVYVSVGGSRFILAPSTGGVFLRDGNDPVISFRIAGGKMLVSTKIKNEKGDLIAELKDNEWVHQQRPAIFDRNYTDHVLEVKDARGKVALQVVDFGKTIHVSAIFRCHDGWNVLLGPRPAGGALFELRPPGVELQYEISPICEYPSDKHLGACPGADSLRPLALTEGAGILLSAALDICPSQSRPSK